MVKSYYIARSRMNARIADTVIQNDSISIDGITYEKVSKAPIGRSVQRRLRKTDESQRIVIYS